MRVVLLAQAELAAAVRAELAAAVRVVLLAQAEPAAARLAQAELVPGAHQAQVELAARQEVQQAGLAAEGS